MKKMKLSSILLFCLTATNLLHSSFAREIQKAREAVYKTKQWQTYNSLRNTFNKTTAGKKYVAILAEKKQALNQLKKTQQWNNLKTAKKTYNKALKKYQGTAQWKKFQTAEKAYQKTPQWQDYVKAQAAIKTELSKLPKATKDALTKSKGTKRKNLLKKIRASTIGKKIIVLEKQLDSLEKALYTNKKLLRHPLPHAKELRSAQIALKKRQHALNATDEQKKVNKLQQTIITLQKTFQWQKMNTAWKALQATLQQKSLLNLWNQNNKNG